ncbi:unnamed protein product, partial [Heterosigma akashiwo]
MGAVISHYTIDEHGKRIETPITFASKTLDKHQKNYSVTEKEGLAVVWACELFRSMLLGRNFILETDHRPCVNYSQRKDPSGRLARWVLKLQQFDVEVIHRSGSKHQNADWCSREGLNSEHLPQLLSYEINKCGNNKANVEIQAHFEGPRPDNGLASADYDSLSQVRLVQPNYVEEMGKRLKLENIAECSKTDKNLKMLQAYQETGEIPDFPANTDKRTMNEVKEWIIEMAPRAVQQRDGIWVVEEIRQKNPHVTERMKKILLPTVLTNEVIAMMHNDGMVGHQSEQRTVNMCKEGYSWPGMGRHIRRFVRTCDKCQSFNSPHASGEVGAYPNPERPFRVVAMDFCGPFDSGKLRSHKHLFVLIDTYTKYCFLVPTRTTQASEAIKAIKERILPHTGIPSVVMCDQGSAFTSKKFKSFADSIGLRIKPTPHSASNSNGLVERLNRTIHLHMAKLISEKGDWSKNWVKVVPMLEFLLRTARNEETNLSQSELLLGFRVSGP